jgi:hypothetical protein
MQVISAKALKDKHNDLDFANEASGSMRVINVDDQPMNVALITDKIINMNKVKRVSNPIWLIKGSTPTPDGLFSNEIFGTTPKARMRNHAYIDLKKKFIHPYIYEVLTRLYRNVDRVCAGESAWYIDDTGKLIEIKDTEDSRYNEDNTGLTWFIDNYHKIKFEPNESDIRSERITLIESLSDDEMFITKWIVIPVFYRDIDRSSGKPSIPELNYAYKDIISYANSLTMETIGFYNNGAMYRIQTSLVKIRRFGQSLIEKKKGAFQQTILGKSVDGGARSVISVPSLNGCDKPSDCIVDICNSGIPLAKCCELGYPFMIKWVTEFFDREFSGRKSMTIYRKKPSGKIEMEEVPIKDQTEVFTKKYIDKKMTYFIHTYGGRFEPIKITCQDGSEAFMLFTGRGYSKDITNPQSATIANRPLTWTDVFYMAAIETLSDKYVYITRYPLTDYFGTFPSHVAVLSTIKTAPVIINNKVYPYYPIIDLSLDEGQVKTQFIDTVSISNLYLEAIGGDYDGDMVSIKMCYSVEANQEAANALNNIKHYVSIKGDIVRTLSNESYLTFYNMTRKE